MSRMKPSLVIWGAAGHGRVVADAARTSAQFDLRGFIDDNPALHGSTVHDLPVWAGLDALTQLPPPPHTQIIIAVGHNATRWQLAQRVLAAGWPLATVIHPRAVLARDVMPGAGTFLAAGAVVNPGCRVGACVIINTLAGVDHDCTLADAVHIAPGAHLAGNVSIGTQTLVGLGAVVREGIRIGAGCTIAAAAAVVADLPDNVLALGVPARIRKGDG